MSEPFPTVGERARDAPADSDTQDPAAYSALTRELRENRARLAFVLEAAHIGYWELDLTTGTALTSFQHDRCFGALEPLSAWSYETFLSYVYPDDRGEVERRFNAAKAQHEDWRFDCRVVWPDGSLHWIESHGSFYRGADTPSLMLGIVTDITARKQTEETLRNDKRRFHQLADAVPQIVWVGDDTGKLVYTNRRWLDYTGLSLERSLEDADAALHPEDRGSVAALWQAKLGQGEPFEYEMRLRHADGTYRWHLVRAVPQRDEDGTLLNWFGTSTDIEERKRSEAHLRFQAEASAALASALDYESTLQSVAELSVPHLADWCAVDRLNAAGELELVAVAHTDPTKTELARELRRCYPPRAEGPTGAFHVVRTGRSKVYPFISEDLLNRVAVDEAHLELLHRIGFRSLIVVPLKLRGRVAGALTLVWSTRQCEASDLALAEELAQRAAVALDNARLYEEARAAERQLRDLNKSLERRVTARTADLEEALNELDQFAYIASHDLKAPLRAMDNLAAWIAQDAGDLLPEKSREHLSKLRGRAARMERLLSDLLTYSRADRLSRAVAPVDVAALVADVTELLEPPPGFSVELHSELSTIVTSVVPLETVLRNLIGNAFKHHHNSRGRVQVTLANDLEVFVFEVVDDGPGIHERFHERIFQVFQTLQPRDRVEASGVGLAVVKKIVEARGGTVGLTSAPGRGATFRFTWPKTDPGAELREPPL